MTSNRPVSEMVELADSIYARCSFWPERTEDGQIALLELRNLYHEAIRPVLAAIPPAVASDDVVDKAARLLANFKPFAGESYNDMARRILALAAIPSAGGVEEMREALKSICREAGKGGERNMASIFSRDKRRITYIPDGLIDWQRCVDRIQNIARAALESTGK